MENNIEYSFGALKSPYDIRDYKICAPKEVVFPLEFSLTRTSIKNQGIVGSCVAHSLASTIEYFNLIQNQIKEPMSVGYIYGNRLNTSYKGEGMYVREALDNLLKYGDVYNYEFPHNLEVPICIDKFNKDFEFLKERGLPHHISAYYKLSSIDEIKYSLMNNGPVIISINWYKDIKLDKDYIIRSARLSEQYKNSHCVIIYGWNEYGWKIQNSWGRLWGDEGCAILPFDYPLNEAWGIVDTFVAKNNIEIKKPFGICIKNGLAKVINFFINLFIKMKGDDK